MQGRCRVASERAPTCYRRRRRRRPRVGRPAKTFLMTVAAGVLAMHRHPAAAAGHPSARHRQGVYGGPARRPHLVHAAARRRVWVPSPVPGPGSGSATVLTLLAARRGRGRRGAPDEHRSGRRRSLLPPSFVVDQPRYHRGDGDSDAASGFGGSDMAADVDGHADAVDVDSWQWGEQALELENALAASPVLLQRHSISANDEVPDETHAAASAAAASATAAAHDDNASDHLRHSRHTQPSHEPGGHNFLDSQEVASRSTTTAPDISEQQQRGQQQASLVAAPTGPEAPGGATHRLDGHAVDATPPAMTTVEGTWDEQVHLTSASNGAAAAAAATATGDVADDVADTHIAAGNDANVNTVAAVDEDEGWSGYRALFAQIAVLGLPALVNSCIEPLLSSAETVLLSPKP